MWSADRRIVVCDTSSDSGAIKTQSLIISVFV